MKFKKITTWKPRILQVEQHDRDIISATQVELLDLTLYPRAVRRPWSKGDILPPLWHMILFPPRIPEQNLADDGYDMDFSPPAPYLKRMWAGGSVTWTKGNELRIGDEVEQKTSVDSVEEKTGARGDMIFVWLRKDVRNQNGPSLTEKRCLVYMKREASASTPLKPGRNCAPFSPDVRRSYLTTAREAEFCEMTHPSTITAFRYSALTFNSHLIHYDHNYSKSVEGHAGCLVHGPLTATYLAGLAYRHLPKGMRISAYDYRAVTPLVVDRDVQFMGRLLNRDGDECSMDVWASNEQGVLAMKGAVLLQRE